MIADSSRAVRVDRNAASKRLRLVEQHLVLLITEVVRLRPLLTLLRLLIIVDEIPERVPNNGTIVERGVIGRRDGFPGHFSIPPMHCPPSARNATDLQCKSSARR